MIQHIAATMVILVSGLCFAAPACAWEPTEADLAEAFLLWASPQAQYAGAAQEEAYRLLTRDSAAAARILPGFFGTPSGHIRDKILTLSEQLGPAAVGPAFRPHTGADSPNLSMAMYCLARAHDTESLPILLTHLRHERHAMRSVAALSIGYLQTPAAIPDLVAALAAETEPMIRKSITFALGQCADTETAEQAIGPLIGALDAGHFAVRFNAARSLSAIGPRAAERLTVLYDNLSDTAKFFALAAVGRMNDSSGLALLSAVSADTAALPVLRGGALKGLLERKIPLADTDLPDLRSLPIGRGLFGLIR